MAQEKKDSRYTLRVLMSEKERKQLKRLCVMDDGTMSEVVRRAIQEYEPKVKNRYARRRLADRAVEQVEAATSTAIY